MAATVLNLWNTVKDGEWIVDRPDLVVCENGEYRTLKVGDPLPKHLFDEHGLWALYQFRKIVPAPSSQSPEPVMVQSSKGKAAGKRAQS